MKNIMLLLVVSISSSSMAQQLTTWNEIKIQRFGKSTLYSTKENIPLKGYYKIASDKGNYSEIRFTDGKINGTRNNYDSDGKRIGSFKYKGGKPHGKWVYFDEKGKPEAVENYKEGNKHGKWWKKKFKKNIYYIRTEHYENDLPIGHWTEKWQNGTLKEERTYKSIGTYIQKEYHKNGKLHTQKSYKDFKQHGVQLVYAVSGILLSRETYHNDVLQKIETFHNNGQLNQLYNYKNGELHGKCVKYKPSGARSLVMRYENGYRIGVWKTYLGDEGWLYFETTYKNDIPNGPHTSYYSNRIIEKEGMFLNGRRNAIWKFYNQAGKLAKEVEYDNGTEVKRVVYNKL
ncbi:toxin-antitoxin system YwqK family antitoxin [Flagellimonas onchidii]|uniref:toxin-antitoxin system YwqK family antitoxin n=1 Tax=Flagellimonas onchidii TaxID=2562684 RepID=UPI00145605A8|nr:toxin-antitoxin system YwqK family antitoxin [Allomuricauda onchidii]